MKTSPDFGRCTPLVFLRYFGLAFCLRTSYKSHLSVMNGSKALDILLYGKSHQIFPYNALLAEKEP